ncbi:MAG: DnaJ domain-containing protein [Paludibacteraceae bacterium]|nr:DnaJ domain-containing protein [Paludibacteraceae bacterium]
MSEEDAYIILGIEKSDSDAEIKKAYRSLAVKCHPDNASSLGDEAIRQATETMKQINVAWDVVKMARGIK